MACLPPPTNKPSFAISPIIHYLDTADRSPWTEAVSISDALPIRPSGSWIETKHKLLTYYAKMFATGMKSKWQNRVYLELFSGPGRCVVRNTNKEQLGSPLKVIEHEFTHFIFTEMRVAAAEALAQRISLSKNAKNAEIWCGDCADAVGKINLPSPSLTFAFIDPTGIGHAPFHLIETLHKRTRCDLLINVQHGMGIKGNMHQYTPDADEESALTKFLGHAKWKTLPRHDAREFFRGVLQLYKEQLDKLGYAFTGREVLIKNTKSVPLYLLLFASKHKRGEEFWNKSMKGVLEPELGLDFGPSEA